MQNEYLVMLKNGLAEAAPVLPYFVFILALIFALYFIEAKFGQKTRGRWRRSSRWASSPRDKVLPFEAPRDKILDAADQLRTVMRADFKAQPLLNKSEARLFKAIDKWVIELAPPGWQVMAQVSLGEILRCEDKAAYGCINSKRVDHGANQHRLGDGAFSP